jgi:hypothetical protein
MKIRNALMGLATVGLLGQTALASPTSPFKTLRAATNADGTFFVGGTGFTVSHPSTGHYHIAFPTGTWNSGSSACFYVPQVQAIFTSAIAEIAGWTTFGDGSGVVDVAVSSGADAPLMLVFTSAGC